MRVTSLVENTSRAGLPVEHGLCLHVLMDDGRQLLFDMGQRRLFADNAVRLGVDLTAVGWAVVSHGHYDHGGGLRAFLELNSQAPVYVDRHAFEPHYSLREDGLKYIGLDPELRDSERLVRCSGVTPVCSGAVLFDGVRGQCLNPPGNRLLFGPTREANDDFRHEQSLLVEEGGRAVLFAGCAHAGLLNIMERAEQLAARPLTHVFAGMHLVKSGLPPDQEEAFIHALADRLLARPACRYFTMHCTGLTQYALLRERMGPAVSYLSCGEAVEL